VESRPPWSLSAASFRSGSHVADPVSFACGPQLACKSIREASPLHSPRLYLTRARVTSWTHSGRLTACCEQIVAAIKILNASLGMHGCTTLPGAIQGECDVPSVIWAPRLRRCARLREAHKAGSAAGKPRGRVEPSAGLWHQQQPKRSQHYCRRFCPFTGLD
jgi:hypothetical protein